MVRVGKHCYGCSISEIRDDLLYEIWLREGVAITLQEKHRDLDFGQMPSPKDGGLPCGMQRETEKGDAAHVWQWRLCLGLRCHAATERLAACEESEVRQAHVGFVDRGADCRLSKPWSIRSARACFHVGELIPQRADTAIGQSRGGCSHEGMCHTGARAVCQHEARFGPIRQ